MVFTGHTHTPFALRILPGGQAGGCIIIGFALHSPFASLVYVTVDELGGQTHFPSKSNIFPLTQTSGNTLTNNDVVYLAGFPLITPLISTDNL